jgi:O-antigen chain-terminating methyltransferase
MLGEQIRDVQQGLTSQIEGKYHDLAEEIGGVHQEQAAALQALHGELTERIEGGHEAQAAALQALRAELTERIGGAYQELTAALQGLRSQLVEQVIRLEQDHIVALQEMRERSSRAERRVRRFVYALTNGQNTDIPEVRRSLPNPKELLEQNHGPYFDYFGFEERFRGSEELIKERHKGYVECFKDADQVLDIGCGRGEFLELLKEAGIKANGVDLDLDMVLYCQEKGLDVVRADVYAYLESLPDESLGGLFAAHLVEHLESGRIIELVNLCQRKLHPGGALIFETPNPVCLVIFARSFYMDFSHIRPIHPEAMKFLFESAGLENLQVKFSAPVEADMQIPPLSGVAVDGTGVEEFNRGIARLNELLYGFQDYAVIGRKPTH